MKNYYCEDCKVWYPKSGSRADQWHFVACHSMQGHKVIQKEEPKQK